LTSAELNADRQRLAELVRGALDISANLIEAGTPAAVEQRLLDGLVGRLGMSGAALWAPSVAGDGVELVRAVGVPDEVLQQVRHLSASSAAAALARAPIAEADDEVPVAVASSSWPGHFVRLVEVPEPARGVLGVYSTGALPRLVDGVLATLAHGLAIASHLTALHARTRSVVDALQSELRPGPTVLPDGIEVGCVYQSATAGVDVGGDFYDVFATERGELGVVCGDVSGKGIEAASLTAMAVHSLRAYALYGAQPQTVVQLLNGMVCERTSDERFMTLTYARIRPETWEVDLAVAGHPPPIVLGPQGVRVLPVPADLPVGIAHDAVYEPIAFSMAPGEALVLYTDGVTEARRHGAGDAQLLGIDGLVAVLGPLTGRSADEVAEGVWAGVQAYAGGGTSDDCAIVVVRRTS
jgi:serine phosphatase RsbU (regulator of sigma subunit)